MPPRRLPRHLEPVRRRGAGVTPRFAGRRLAHTAFLVAGLIVGLAWALPLPDVSDRCPAGGEGLTLCTLQKVWAATAIKLAAALLAAHLLGWLALDRIPEWRRRWRAGERPRPGRRASRRALRDHRLRAAAWGRVSQPEEEDERGPLEGRASFLERVGRRRVVRVRSARDSDG